MLVAVSGFGSIWRTRVRERGGARPKIESAYYNTTGVLVRGVLRQRPKISGLVRFNGDSGLDPNFPSRSLESIFECAEPCLWQGQNKLHFKRKVGRRERPDMFLLVLAYHLHGALPLGTENWRSNDTWLISLSEYRQEQESLLLAAPNAWFRTSLGLWVVEPLDQPWQCRARFLGPSSSAAWEGR